ncbi:mycothiol transferase [Kribbella sp. NBC_00359]|uniref:mycothiol transferase n=1 Tax=Kribbella sp. NBC_00359 TaxID=2975966 RepID=UPI003FA5777E
MSARCFPGSSTKSSCTAWTCGRRPISLRSMVLTVLPDTTRHAGHADVVREMLDGRVGSHPGDVMVSDDEEQLRMYRARITGRLDRDAWMAYVRSRPDYDPSAWESHRDRVNALWFSHTPP